MADIYTGVRVHSVRADTINELYKNKEVEIFDNRYKWPQNLYLVLKDECGGQQSALARVKGDKIVLLNQNIQASGIKPKNKEQAMAMDALLDDDIKIVALTGCPGSGKTLLAVASALLKSEQKKYSRVIFSKNSPSVGKELGFLPGSLEEKTTPFNQGVLCNLALLFDNNRKLTEDAINMYNIEFIPTAVLRGSSFMSSQLIIDEVQNLSTHELLTTGTRVGEGSKIVLLGDLKQIDVKMRKEATGIYRFINSPLVQNSSFTASIHLIKNERSEVAKLFADVLEDDE